ncbi:hypothetical protein CRN76_12290 [Chryseobacterium indologenes]|uniref:Uncharacterized protein n=1 Tax=Chryseobacterium indologenes TaxID=253 RepID=A0AAD0YWH8_CHRID|nr:hypothetical protein [Chryseobacterium indologenes]ATN06122.1 hypothetical protein CRN76_12290 [Chryseobacterium indologenes]AYY85118.1 hypothetical protein EGX91_11450 [Chryseobacterium indologenes]AZB18001.1 hypothetical protein EG352_09560 [Chryseobacterium indologenes]QIX82004.1 hypothetical protein FOB56_12505 [Chryseobacterium indologenes]TLX25485.1 hypothetical protein FE904_11010 [Chryseobacterium indologenes]
MKKNQSNNYGIFLNILIIVYTLYISLSVFKEKVIVTDDLSKVYESKLISGSYFTYIYSFLDSTTMAARPVSGFVTGTLIYLSKYDESVYLLGLIFFPLSLAVLYMVAKKILSEELAGLITLLYSCSVIGTSIQFSPIMLNSNLATVFFSLSIYFLYVRDKILVSALLFIASILSYEIFFPLILLHLFLIKENKKRILFVIITLGSVVLFRKVIQPLLFVNSYQRDEVSKIFEMKRVVQIAVFSGKLFFKDIFAGLYRGILNLKNLGILEWILALSIPATVYKVFSVYDFKSQSARLRNIAVISFLALLCGFSIFLFSSYIPTIFGFDNRNLGAIRLFYTLFVISIIIYASVRIKLGNKIIAAAFAVIAFLLIATNISVKNSWIYASRFNDELFSKLKTSLDENHIESGNVCLDYNMFNELKNNSHFTLREPVFYNDWEGPMLSERAGIDSRRIHVYNRERKIDCEMVFLYKNGKVVRIK